MRIVADKKRDCLTLRRKGAEEKNLFLSSSISEDQRDQRLKTLCLLFSFLRTNLRGKKQET
jgi:hypothetical protein